MLARKVTVEPAEEPLSLVETKRFLRITSDDEDADILDLIAAARKRVEREAELALITQTIEVKLDGFWCGRLPLPAPPLQSVTSITYLDLDGAPQTLLASVYKVSTHERPGCIWLAYGQAWPETYPEREAVTITYVAGFVDANAVPANLVHAMRLLCAHYDIHREAVVRGKAPALLPEGVEALLRGERIPEIEAVA